MKSVKVAIDFRMDPLPDGAALFDKLVLSVGGKAVDLCQKPPFEFHIQLREGTHKANIQALDVNGHTLREPFNFDLVVPGGEQYDSPLSFSYLIE